MSIHRIRSPGLASAAAFVLMAAMLCGATGALSGWELGDEAQIFQTSEDMDGFAVAPDGMGGMLVAVADRDPDPDRILVSRVDHNGNEVWGDGGIWLPIILGSAWSSDPLAIAPDGNGGAYIAYIVGYDTYQMLTFSHCAETGECVGTFAVDNLGIPDPGDAPVVQLLATEGELIITWKRYVPAAALHAARFNADGSLLWHTDVNTAWGDGTGWSVISDGGGGALVAYSRGTTPTETRVQRLAGADGARLWGADGTLVWTNMGGDHAICRDNAGGCYVVCSVAGVAWAQHLDASGSVTWSSDRQVHDSQTLYFNLSTMPIVCTDGSGGLILVHGLETLFAQRLDVSGSLPWGTGGVVVENYPDIGRGFTMVTDGTGGALVGYHLTWTITGTSTPCRQVQGARVDGFGNVVWTDILDWCRFAWIGGVPVVSAYPHEVQVVADGSGGAQFAWLVRDSDTNDDEEAWAKGLAADGSAPTPALSFLTPDAAAPGEVGPYLIFGDYIDLGLQYRLIRDDGAAIIDLGPDQLHSYQLLGGIADLTGAERGAYHLEVLAGGTVADTFPYAAGIGDALPCEGDQVLLETRSDVIPGGSQRQAAYDGDGNLHMAWTAWNPDDLAYRLLHRVRNGETWSEPHTVFMAGEPLRHPTLAVDHRNGVHVAVVVDINSAESVLVYAVLDIEGNVRLLQDWGNGRVNSRPILAIDESNLAHLVFRSTVGMTGDIRALTHDGGAFSEQIVVDAAGDPRDHDLTAAGAGLMLTFVRDSIIPGVEQVDYRAYADGTWQAPHLVSFGLATQSPSVAWDGGNRLLFAWILDNEAINGIPPMVHTAPMIDGVLGQARARPGLSQHHAVSVASTGPRSFYLLSLESGGGPDRAIFVRPGDGRVFFPRRQVNAHDDVDFPLLAAAGGGNRVFAYWSDYVNADQPLLAWECEGQVSAVGPPPAYAADGLRSYPNPFNPSTTLAFHLDERQWVRLVVFDLRGRRVRELANRVLAAGDHVIAWDGNDDDGRPLGSGPYFARLERAAGHRQVAKVTLLK